MSNRICKLKLLVLISLSVFFAPSVLLAAVGGQVINSIAISSLEKEVGQRIEQVEQKFAKGTVFDFTIPSVLPFLGIKAGNKGSGDPFKDKDNSPFFDEDRKHHDDISQNFHHKDLSKKDFFDDSTKPESSISISDREIIETEKNMKEIVKKYLDEGYNPYEETNGSIDEARIQNDNNMARVDVDGVLFDGEDMYENHDQRHEIFDKIYPYNKYNENRDIEIPNGLKRTFKRTMGGQNGDVTDDETEDEVEENQESDEDEGEDGHEIENTGTKLIDLPCELIFEIFSYCKSNEIGSAVKTCKEFVRILMEDEKSVNGYKSFWFYLLRRDFPEIVLSGNFPEIKKKFNQRDKFGEVYKYPEDKNLLDFQQIYKILSKAKKDSGLWRKIKMQIAYVKAGLYKSLDVEGDALKGWYLNIACELGNFDLIKYLVECLLKSGGTIYYKSKKLDKAALFGDLETLKYLLAKLDLDPTLETLKNAAKSGSLEVLKYLFGAKVFNLDYSDSDYLIFCAAESGNVDMLKYLLNTKKFNVDIEVRHIDRAIEYGNLEMLKYLLDTKKFDVDIKDRHIIQVIKFGNLEMLKYLLDTKKFNVDFKDSFCFVSEAVKVGNLEMLKYLYEVKKINYVPDCNYFRDIVFNNLEVLKYLYDQLKSGNETCKYEVRHVKFVCLDTLKILHNEFYFADRFLKHVVSSGNLEVLKYLLDPENNFNYKLTREVFEKAIQSGNLEVLQCLLDFGGKNRKMVDDILGCVVGNNNIEMLQYLIESCKFFSIVVNNRSLLSRAVVSGNLEVFKHLLDPKNKFNLKPTDSIFYFLSENFNSEIFKYLLDPDNGFSFDFSNCRIGYFEKKYSRECIDLLKKYLNSLDGDKLPQGYVKEGAQKEIQQALSEELHDEDSEEEGEDGEDGEDGLW